MPRRDVHAGRRLVEDEQSGVGQQREGEAQPLLLAAGALGDPPVREGIQPRSGDDVVDWGVSGIRAGNDPHRLADGEVAQQATGLQDRGDGARGDRVPRLLAEDPDRARGGVGQAESCHVPSVL